MLAATPGNGRTAGVGSCHRVCRTQRPCPGTRIALLLGHRQNRFAVTSDVDVRTARAAQSAAPADPEAPHPCAPASALVDGAKAESAPKPPSGTSDLRLAGAAVRTAVLAVLAVTVVATLHFGRPILMPILVAMLLSLLLSPLVSLIERIGLHRAIASVIVVLFAAACVAALSVHLAAPAQQWLETGPERIEQLREKVRTLRAPVDRVSAATERVAEITANDARAAPREVVVQRTWTAALIANVQAIVINAVIVVILLYFLLSSGDLFQRKLIRVVPTLDDKIRAIEISRTIQQQIGRYFAAITLINSGLGVVVGLTMAALGMPTPALIGAIAGILNFVPYLGSLVTLSIVAIVSVLTFDDIPAMLLPPAVYLLLTVVEGQVVQPIVLGRHLSTAPVVIFIWVLTWGWLWGVGGVVIAVPLLVAAKICAEHLPSWKPLAELLGRD
jgi:predicted PurR-regulated permease PerM